MAIIPKEFALFGNTYKVVFKDNLISEGDENANCSFRDQEIRIQSLGIGIPMTEQKQVEVFYHELTHAILEAMGHKLTHDEHFVDQFSRLLNQAIQTSQGDLNEV